MVIIETKGINKTFKREDDSYQKVLSDINFKVKEGECFTIIGPNGSGKTTLLKIMSLLEPPTDGKVIYNQKDITSLTKKEKVEVRRNFSFVRQKPVVLNASVYDNIAYGLKVRELDSQFIEQKVNKMIKTIGLNGMENKNARSLSGGEMQRVAIAMNFVLDPDIYFLDEVSANLDPKNILLLEQFINKIKRKKKTIIMSTHDKMEAIKFADRIAVLNNGTISQIGSVNDIFTSPKDEYAAVFVGYENVFTGIAKPDNESGLNSIKINDMIITASSEAEGFVKVCIRPESIGIMKSPPKKVSYQNTFKGRLEEVRDLGNICHIIVNCSSERFLVTITKDSLHNLKLEQGTQVYINFKATDIKIL
jgi:tungstate transport system ATP-binding protein